MGKESSELEIERYLGYSDVIGEQKWSGTLHTFPLLNSSIMLSYITRSRLDIRSRTQPRVNLMNTGEN